jgi:hypothetical protein
MASGQVTLQASARYSSDANSVWYVLERITSHRGLTRRTLAAPVTTADEII